MSLVESTPSVYSQPFFHKGSGHWCQWIGYWLSSTSRRVRAYHTLGRNQNEAIARSVELQKEWRLAVDTWPQRRLVLAQLLPGFDWSKPVLNDSEPIEQLIQKKMHAIMAPDGELALMAARARRHAEEDDRDDLERIKDRNPHLLAPHVPPASLRNLTIAEAKDRFFAAKRREVGLAGGRGIKSRTMRGIEKMLTVALGQSTSKDNPRLTRNPIDLNRFIQTLTSSDLQKFVDFWMALPDGISERTAVNYVGQLKAMLAWCAESEDLDFKMPKGAARDQCPFFEKVRHRGIR